MTAAENPENENPKPEDVIDYICESGPYGRGWVVWNRYTNSELLQVKDLVVKKLESSADDLTQQVDPRDEQTKFTYSKVLGQVMVRIKQELTTRGLGEDNNG